MGVQAGLGAQGLCGMRGGVVSSSVGIKLMAALGYGGYPATSSAGCVCWGLGTIKWLGRDVCGRIMAKNSPAIKLSWGNSGLEVKIF